MWCGPRVVSKFETIAEQITKDGYAFAAKALEIASGSPDIALAILGVAAGKIIDGIEPARRAAVLRDYLDSF